MSDSKVGLANPYAIAEIAIGRKVNWKAIKNHDAFIEKTLGVSIEKLVAPVPGNPFVSGSPDSKKALSDLQPMKSDKPHIASPQVEGDPVQLLLSNLNRTSWDRLIHILLGGHTPPGAEWADPGEFFEEGAEYSDPVQGVLGDCYLIAALCAVAWARPNFIFHRERTTGPGQEQFVDPIDFYSGGTKTIEVTELMPVLKSTHAWIYARSSESGEIWPAVFEKAYAKWKTNEPTDEPDYNPIAGGWPVQATTELTNLIGTTKTCADLFADDIWTSVRSNSLSYRTINPMTAWTFCQTPSPVDYNGTGIYAYHAYTILGWAYVNNIKYIVLRNPWGQNVSVINGLTGNWSAIDQTFWRTVPLNSAGVFAIPADTFKKYYWQFGWAK